MRYLGIDYGKRKVGIAISEGELASPFKIVQVKDLNDAVAKITQIAQSEKVDLLVVGLPESGEARKITEKFIRKISTLFPVEVIEETLTTWEAQHLFPNVGKNKEDAVAASLILQNYLDQKRTRG